MSTSLQSALQPGLGEAQIMADEMNRHIQRFSSFFGRQTAEALNMSVHVVRHDLRFAQAWLKRRLQ